MKYTLDKGCHSNYSIQFHYVCCVKYRRKVLTEEVSEYLKEINQSIAEKFEINIVEQETDQDHMHILFTSKPQIQVSKFINSLKSVSARLIFKKYPEIKTKLWKGHFWSPSYFLASVGEVKLADVKRYVETQGSKDIQVPSVSSKGTNTEHKPND
jgi:putative transposase